MIDFCPSCFNTPFDSKCSVCGYIMLSDVGMEYILRPGTILANTYLLGRVLGAGGFGITYIAKTMQTGKIVAIKEYMPASQAVRLNDGKTVCASSEENKKTFEHGIEVFNREAQTLKAFAGNNNIVEVIDSFNENNTSYFVMEYLDGVTLGGLARANGNKLDIMTAMEILKIIANTLTSVHEKGMLHRDVSPENIFITRKGEVKLIDFGATRFFVGEKSRSLSVVLKAGFAPPEQYSGKGNQGPWTDLYALCATFYTIIFGHRPPDAPDRLGGEGIMPLTSVGVEQNVATVIEKGLELDYRNRYNNMHVFLQNLHAARMGEYTPLPYVEPVNPNEWGKEDIKEETPPPPPFKRESDHSPVSENREILADEDISKPDKLTGRGTPYVRNVTGGTNSDRWVLPKNIPLIIGRSSEKCNIVLDNINISRVHCEIRYDEKQTVFFLRDLSTNGTYTDNGRLQKGIYYPIEIGAKFYILNQDCIMEVGLC